MDPLMPTMPKLDTGVGDAGSAGPSYGNVMKLIQSSGQPNLTNTVMPSLLNLLSPGGQATSPYAREINQNTAGNVSSVQTDMMKRGLTGSDIEAGSMGAARAAGGNSLATMYGQTANSLSQLIFQAASGDINSQRSTLLQLAEAMGQKITSDQDLSMFQKQLAMSMDQASKNRESQLYGALIGAGGSILGGMARGGMAGPGAGFPVG